MPAPPAEAARFLSETVIIALAGADVNDLHNAKWAEIRREPYVGAAKFLTAHNLFYSDVTVSPEEAASQFAERGCTTAAVLERAVPIEASGMLKHRLEGPADMGVAGAQHEQTVAVDGEAVESEEEAGADFHAAIPDPEHPEEALPPLSVCADELTSGDLDELQALRKVHAELEQVRALVAEDVAAETSHCTVPKKRVRALQQATRQLLQTRFADKVERGARAIETLESGGGVPEFEAYAQGTGSRPLSMYGPEHSAFCFPKLFPYGDGVFGLPRRMPLTFQQCVGMHLLREELHYQVSPDVLRDAAAWFAGADTAEPAPGMLVPPPPETARCTCAQCVSATGAYQPPEQPRWGADRELLCCYYDSMRRMEQIRKARGHVVRAGWRMNLDAICKASAGKIDGAIASLGDDASVKDVLRAPQVDQDVKTALSELMVFTADVLGSDGARARLRHEQNGYALCFGPAGVFLTPNVADTRSPLVVHLHSSGRWERFEVNLLEEEPAMPSAREMLRIIAQDPVAQARFFILAMRLFCEHVLGTGPVDELLRHNGRADGAAFPDGFAASGLGGALGMLAAFHGPIEEQARLSLHPHVVLWFVHTQSELWLRSLLREDRGEEARALLRGWQERVLAAVQSMQLDSAAVLPPLLTADPASAAPPRNTPFSEHHQKECRMDGELEGDARDPERRPCLATEPLFEDHHLRGYRERLAPGSRPVPEYQVRQTGAQLCRLPQYRLLEPVCAADLETEVGRRAEQAAWGRAYAEDYRCNIAVGQMHAHKDTCFKYVVDKAVRVAKHCRFHFCHFVKLFPPAVEGGGAGARPRVREVTLARTGKDLALPRDPACKEAPSMSPTDAAGQPVRLAPATQLGPTVDCDLDHGKAGLVKPIR